MMGKLLIILSFLIVCSFISLSSSNQNCQQRKIVCYFSGWSIYRNCHGQYDIEDIPGDLCTHVVYSFIGVDELNWEYLILDSYADIDKKGFERFSNLSVKYPHLKKIIAVGGWTEGGKKYSELVKDQSRRATFINSIIRLLQQYQFNGIDIDWEYPGDLDRNGSTSDKNNFYYFISELREAFDDHNPDWEISIAAPLTKQKVNQGYHVSDLCSIVNNINIMAYNLRGDWQGFADVHSPLYERSFDNSTGNSEINVNDGVQLWKDYGCPADKLVVGIPFFGYSFTLNEPAKECTLGTSNLSHKSGEAAPITTTEGTAAYYEICREVQGDNPHWSTCWDDEGKVPYAYKGNYWIGYENATSIKHKMEWIKSNNYGGASVWSIDMDDFRGICGQKYPLLNAIYENLNKTST